MINYKVIVPRKLWINRDTTSGIASPTIYLEIDCLHSQWTWKYLHSGTKSSGWLRYWIQLPEKYKQFLSWSYTSNKIAQCNLQHNLISTHVNWKCLQINYKSQGNMCRHFYLTCVEIIFCCKLQQFCCLCNSTLTSSENKVINCTSISWTCSWRVLHFVSRSFTFSAP
jgi:hypothetical protein